MKTNSDLRDFVLLMHSDTERSGTPDEWTIYFKRLRESGRFQGGSTIGSGECVRKAGPPGQLHSSLGGYIRVLARDLEDAKALVSGNPVFENGGTVEVRELPETG